MAGYEEGLRRRTEGITWMIWALVFAGIAMSYWVMGLLSPPGAEDAAAILPDRGLVTPWIGWAVAGGLATAALWRGAALGGASGLRHVAALGAIMAGTWVLFILSWLLPPAISQHLYAGGPLVFFGLATLLVVATDLVPLSALGKRAARVVAAVQIACALAVGLMQAWGAMPSPLPVPVELLGAILLGASWLGAGLWQSAQG
ncbi:MAG TPA: hypothetical protein VM582_07525 [Candidatus Thermoplasmatota archaeon]|nr:hypothetical protein [Candidatus Thermoplasmatota archaeon]